MFRLISEELKSHAPFTIFGALTGVLVVFFFRNLPPKVSFNVFYVLHPMHVVLSALVTTSMYEKHKCWASRKQCNLWVLLFVGYAGAIGVATLSDSLVPYLGEVLLGLPKRRLHIGFLEMWWLVNPLALVGIAIAYFRPATKFPHAGHVLLSMWASLFHIIMAMEGGVSWAVYAALFVFLFVAVWIPCCISDIVFPLLFVKDRGADKKGIKKGTVTFS